MKIWVSVTERGGRFDNGQLSDVMELPLKAVMRMNEPTPTSVTEVPLRSQHAKNLPHPNLPLDRHLLLLRPPTQHPVLRQRALHPSLKKPPSALPLCSHLPRVRTSPNVRIWICSQQTTAPRPRRMVHLSVFLCYLETANNIATTATSPVNLPDRPRESHLPV